MLRLDMNDEMTLYNLSRWLERPQADVLRLALRNLELDYIQGKTKKVYDDCHIGS